MRKDGEEEMVKKRKEWVEEKEKIGLSIKKEIMDDFRRFLAEKYGDVRKGYISSEVEQAIQAWICTHKAHIVMNKPNPSHDLRVIKNEIEKYLTVTFGYRDIYQVPRKHFEFAIGAVRGTDQRTVRKWSMLLEKYGLIKWLTPNLVEFV